MSINQQIKKLFDPWIKSRKKIPSFIPHAEKDYYWHQWLPDTEISCKKIIYIGGDSWMHQYATNPYLMKTYPNTCIINRSRPSAGNGDIIRILEQDIAMLKQIDIPIIFLIVFSEIGRNRQEIDTDQLKNYSAITDYLKVVQRLQFQKVDELTQHLDAEVICTTAYVPNLTNSNPSVIDFIDTPYPKPCDCLNLTSKFYAWFVDQGYSHGSQLMTDLDNLDAYVTWLTGLREIDKTAHIKADFLDIYHRFFTHFFKDKFKGD